MADTKKVEIGFGIGQALSVKLSDDELKDLRKAVAGDGRLVRPEDPGRNDRPQPRDGRVHPGRRLGHSIGFSGS